MNRAIRTVLVCAVLLSLGVAGTLGVNAKRPRKLRSLVWRSSSSDEENKLTIDLKGHRAKLYVFGLGVQRLDGGPTDRTRKIVRDLPLPEIQDLSRLAAGLADARSGPWMAGPCSRQGAVVTAAYAAYVDARSLLGRAAAGRKSVMYVAPERQEIWR